MKISNISKLSPFERVRQYNSIVSNTLSFRLKYLESYSQFKLQKILLINNSINQNYNSRTKRHYQSISWGLIFQKPSLYQTLRNFSESSSNKNNWCFWNTQINQKRIQDFDYQINLNNFLKNTYFKNFHTLSLQMKLPEETIEQNPIKYFKTLNPQRHKIVPHPHLFLANLSDEKLNHIRQIASKFWELHLENESYKNIEKEGFNESIKEEKLNESTFINDENNNELNKSINNNLKQINENYYSDEISKEVPPIIALYSKPDKNLAFISFMNVQISKQVFDYLTNERSDIHVQYAKLRTETDFLIGLTNISSKANQDRIKSIPGLIYIENYITEEEEKFISQNIHTVPRHNEVFSENNGRDIKRSIWHFGYEFKYSNNTAGRVADPLPEPIQFLVERIISTGKELSFISKGKHYRNAKGKLLDSPQDDLQLRVDEYYDIPNQCTVNEYQVGEGIAPHIDNAEEFGKWVASLSLMSDTVMCFKDPKGENKIIDVILPRRSLIILTGPSRYSYLHSIRHRRFDAIDGQLKRRDIRMSVTLRHAYTMGSSCNLVSKNINLQEYIDKVFA